jgi:capsular polysaccharide biosynthesis protein
MSQQALDLRKSIQMVRQHKVLLGVMVALGIAGGAAYGVLKPPMLVSTALIALPTSQSIQPATATGGATTTTGGTDAFTATQEVVAGSYQVLFGALHGVRPAMSVTDLRRYVQIGSPSPNIISVTATGKTAADAEATANAVTESYIRYVTSPHSAVGQVTAHLLASASSATGPSRTGRTVLYALLGALVGVLMGVILILAIGRSDRRLRQRDDIANSIGVPVLASVPAARPSAAAGWTRLLENYKPTARHSWQLLTALEQLGMARPVSGRSGYNYRNGSRHDDRSVAYDRDGASFSLAVLSLSSDPGALALGPQLAAFAASQGIPTSLVVGPQQDAAVTASLRIACSTPLSPDSSRRGLLRVSAYERGDLQPGPDSALVVVVVVVDSRAPEMPDTMRTSATVIGVSAGVATAEQLARAAVIAAADGRETTGILVADPLEADQTTGRIPRLGRPTPPAVPNRLRGVVTEIRR